VHYAIDFYRKKQLPITDDFDLSVINDGQIQLLEKLEQAEVKIITGINKNKVCQSLSVFLVFPFNPNPRSLAILFQTWSMLVILAGRRL
jgi:hypothetical protein